MLEIYRTSRGFPNATDMNRPGIGGGPGRDIVKVPPLPPKKRKPRGEMTLQEIEQEKYDQEVKDYKKAKRDALNRHFPNRPENYTPSGGFETIKGRKAVDEYFWNMIKHKYPQIQMPTPPKAPPSLPPDYIFGTGPDQGGFGYDNGGGPTGGGPPFPGNPEDYNVTGGPFPAAPTPVPAQVGDSVTGGPFPAQPQPGGEPPMPQGGPQMPPPMPQGGPQMPPQMPQGGSAFVNFRSVPRELLQNLFDRQVGY